MRPFHPLALMSSGATMALALLQPLVAVDASERLLAIRVIKQHIGEPPSQPTIHATLEGQPVQPHRDPHPEYGPRYFGVNAYELYFHLPIPSDVQHGPQIRVDWPGVQVRRVLVGRRDAAFAQQDDVVTFTAPLEFSRNTMIITSVRHGEMGRGGIQIPLVHHREASAAGYYRAEAGRPFPWTGVHAANNLAFAFREVLILEKLYGEALHHEGGWSLNTFETTFEHGHVDAPPHVHATLLPGEGRLDWSRHQAPHFRFDDRGLLTHNTVHDRLDGDMQERRYEPGQPWTVRDFRTGKPLVHFTVTDAGTLTIQRTSGRHLYHLKPLHGEGFANGVLIERDHQPLCRVTVDDRIENGRTEIQVRYHVEIERESFREILRYDRDTGRMLTHRTEPLPPAR